MTVSLDGRLSVPIRSSDREFLGEVILAGKQASRVACRYTLMADAFQTPLRLGPEP
jgi:hypothetical protein